MSGSFVTYTIADPLASLGLYPSLLIDTSDILHFVHHAGDDGTLIFDTLDPYNEL